MRRNFLLFLATVAARLLIPMNMLRYVVRASWCVFCLYSYFDVRRKTVDWTATIERIHHAKIIPVNEIQSRNIFRSSQIIFFKIISKNLNDGDRIEYYNQYKRRKFDFDLTKLIFQFSIIAIYGLR